MRLEKYHGLGNDFLIGFNDAFDPANGSEIARKVCHRDYETEGADGLILAIHPPIADMAEMLAGKMAPVKPKMRLWNSDGSLAEVSGNGLRCLAFAYARLLEEQDLTIRIHTDAGSRLCNVFLLDTKGGSLGIGAASSTMANAKVDMGQIEDHYRPTTLDDLLKKLGVKPIAWDSIRVGNPHVVHAVDDLSNIDLAEIGPIIQEQFPDGINVHFVSVSPGEIEMRSYERGAGITEACGSGAVAAVTLAKLWHSSSLVPNPVGDKEETQVHMPGGVATVDFRRGTPTLQGPVTYIATYEIK